MGTIYWLSFMNGNKLNDTFLAFVNYFSYFNYSVRPNHGSIFNVDLHVLE